MVVPFIALIAVVVLIIWFFAGAAKRKNKGRDIGEPGKKMGG